MPYIKSKHARKELDDLVYTLIGIGEGGANWSDINFTGKLNYFLFKLARLCCKNYGDYRDFIGELEAAKLEIYRRQIAPYEDKKIKENGDVE